SGRTRRSPGPRRRTYDGAGCIPSAALGDDFSGRSEIASPWGGGEGGLGTISLAGRRSRPQGATWAGRRGKGAGARRGRRDGRGRKARAQGAGAGRAARGGR